MENLKGQYISHRFETVDGKRHLIVFYKMDKNSLTDVEDITETFQAWYKAEMEGLQSYEETRATRYGNEFSVGKSYHPEDNVIGDMVAGYQKVWYKARLYQRIIMDAEAGLPIHNYWKGKYTETSASQSKTEVRVNSDLPTRNEVADSIPQLIAEGEGSQLEFKETLEVNIKTDQKDGGVLASALKTIAAFLNTEGGTLLIGVSDTRRVMGLERDYKLCNKHDKDGFEQKIRSLISTRFNPVPLGTVDISFEQLPDGEVCVVQIVPIDKPEVVHLDKKDVYVRDGNVTRKLEGQALTRWITQRAKE